MIVVNDGAAVLLAQVLPEQEVIVAMEVVFNDMVVKFCAETKPVIRKIEAIILKIIFDCRNLSMVYICCFLFTYNCIKGFLLQPI